MDLPHQKQILKKGKKLKNITKHKKTKQKTMSIVPFFEESEITLKEALKAVGTA